MFISIPLIVAVSSALLVSTSTYTSVTIDAHARSQASDAVVRQTSSAVAGESGSTQVHITTIVNGEKVVDIHETSTNTPLSVESVYIATSSKAYVRVENDIASPTHPVDETVSRVRERIDRASVDPTLQHPVPHIAAPSIITNIITESEESKTESMRHPHVALWTHFSVSHAQTIAYVLSFFPF